VGNLNLTVDNVLDIAVAALTDDELIELVKRIDVCVEDWDFTLPLAKYFDEQRAEWDAEEAEREAREAAVVEPTVD
jgi:hypothetical protein